MKTVCRIVEFYVNSVVVYGTSSIAMAFLADYLGGHVLQVGAMDYTRDTRPFLKALLIVN